MTRAANETKESKMNRRYFSVEIVSRHFKISVAKLVGMKEAGHIRMVRSGRQLMMSFAEIKRFRAEVL
jgi:hypothetical protein